MTEFSGTKLFCLYTWQYMHTTKQTPVTCLLFSGMKLGLPKCPLNCSFGCLLLSNMNVPRNSSKIIHILLRPGKIVLIIEVLWLKEKRYSMWISRQIYFYCMNNKMRNWNTSEHCLEGIILFPLCQRHQDHLLFWWAASSWRICLSLVNWL